jgi:hypothetical protein
VDPLDLTEDPRTGNLYVSEYGGNGTITLLKPDFVNITTSGSELSIREPFSVSTSDKPKVSPIPVQQKFTIAFPTTYKGNFHLQLIDGAGRIYELGKVNIIAGGGSIEIDKTKWNLRPGVYFLCIISDTGKKDVIMLMMH